MELWDIVVFLHMAITRQLNLEALTVNAPPSPLMYPLPGGVIMDDHRRKRAGRAGRGEGSVGGGRSSMDFGKSSDRFSKKRSSLHSGVFKASASLWDWKTPLWLQKLHRLVGSAMHGLVSDYVYHQPTIVLVWIFISLIFVHFFMWLKNEIAVDSHDPEMAAAAVVGWLFLVRGKDGALIASLTLTSTLSLFIDVPCAVPAPRR